MSADLTVGGLRSPVLRPMSRDILTASHTVLRVWDIAHRGRRQGFPSLAPLRPDVTCRIMSFTFFLFSCPPAPDKALPQ
jgi:hypothetical protein